MSLDEAKEAEEAKYTPILVINPVINILRAIFSFGEMNISNPQHEFSDEVNLLLEKFRGKTEFREWLENCEARYNVSVPDVWFVATLLYPKLIGNRLTQFELQKAVSWIKENKPGDLTAFMNYIGGEKEQVKEAFIAANGAKVENFLEAQNSLQ